MEFPKKKGRTIPLAEKKIMGIVPWGLFSAQKGNCQYSLQC
jgi:hypothetical protein